MGQGSQAAPLVLGSLVLQAVQCLLSIQVAQDCQEGLKNQGIRGRLSVRADQAGQTGQAAPSPPSCLHCQGGHGVPQDLEGRLFLEGLGALCYLWALAEVVQGDLEAQYYQGVQASQEIPDHPSVQGSLGYQSDQKGPSLPLDLVILEDLGFRGGHSQAVLGLPSIQLVQGCHPGLLVLCLRAVQGTHHGLVLRVGQRAQ